MKTQNEITADIDRIIGLNNEVTDDTHMDLIDEITEYILDLNKESKDELREDWIITVRKRLEELYAKPFNGHPSREDISKNKDAIFFLADQIDHLHKIRIKSKKP
jgi:hypothetical protein